MAYTSIIPVSRLDNSITYIRNKDKTTKKGQSAGSLEEAIDYAIIGTRRSVPFLRMPSAASVRLPIKIW